MYFTLKIVHSQREIYYRTQPFESKFILMGKMNLPFKILKICFTGCVRLIVIYTKSTFHRVPAWNRKFPALQAFYP